jgi:hypothetical protein
VIEAPTHRSPYPLPTGREPILVHEGELELHHDDGVIRGRGRLELVVLPGLRFTFVLPNVPIVGPNVIGVSELAASGLEGRLEAFAGHASLGPAGLVSGSAEGAVGDAERASLGEVRFLVANLPDYIGDSLHGRRPLPDGGSQESYWRGRLSSSAVDWRIDLDLRSDHESIYARLKGQGGFEITHVGSLRRENGQPFSGTEAGEMLDALAGFLGFVCGAWAPPIAAVGLHPDDRVIWRELKGRWTSPWRTRLCAFDHHKHALSGAFVGYLARWNDLLWNEPLRIATQLYVEANGPVTADTSLVLSQNVLELIAWVRFVEQLGTRTAQDFDNLKASDRLRELLGWMQVDPSIPAQLTALANEATRHRLMTTPGMARIELQELALWYVELALLRLIDFQGSYANRLGEKLTGVVEEVP